MTNQVHIACCMQLSVSEVVPQNQMSLVKAALGPLLSFFFLPDGGMPLAHVPCLTASAGPTNCPVCPSERRWLLPINLTARPRWTPTLAAESECSDEALLTELKLLCTQDISNLEKICTVATLDYEYNGSLSAISDTLFSEHKALKT